jgi:hypothetical protein
MMSTYEEDKVWVRNVHAHYQVGDNLHDAVATYVFPWDVHHMLRANTKKFWQWSKEPTMESIVRMALYPLSKTFLRSVIRNAGSDLRPSFTHEEVVIVSESVFNAFISSLTF